MKTQMRIQAVLAAAAALTLAACSQGGEKAPAAEAPGAAAAPTAAPTGSTARALFAGLPAECQVIADHYDRQMQCTTKTLGPINPGEVEKMNADTLEQVRSMAQDYREAGAEAAEQCKTVTQLLGGMTDTYKDC